MFRELLANNIELRKAFISFKSFYDSASASADSYFVLNFRYIFRLMFLYYSYKKDCNRFENDPFILAKE